MQIVRKSLRYQRWKNVGYLECCALKIETEGEIDNTDRLKKNKKLIHLDVDFAHLNNISLNIK